MFTLCVCRVFLDANFVLLDGLVEFVLGLQHHRLALVSLGPVWLQLDALFSVSECLFILLELVVGSAAIAEDRVVRSGCLQGLPVEANGTGKVLGFKAVVSLVFECRHICSSSFIYKIALMTR